MNAFCFSLILTIFISSVSSLQDDYLDETQATCQKHHDGYSCFKYRALKYISGVAEGNMWPLNWNRYNNATFRSNMDENDKLFRLVQMENHDFQDVDEIFEGSRQMQSDSEYDKITKYGMRLMEIFLKKHGIGFNLPEGARAISEDEQWDNSNEIPRNEDGKAHMARGKRKRLAIFLPLLSLLSLVKVKMLLVPILLSVLFIKKILVLTALFLPSILASLKVCKTPHPHHVAYGSGEVAADYSGNYGAYPTNTNPVYAKEWAASRAYESYRPSAEMNSRNPPVYGMSNGFNSFQPAERQST